MSNSFPKVSVVTITYRHQDYILETIKGVLMQEYCGEIEFIIANDNSPDDTHQVVTDFFNSNTLPPSFILKYTKHEKNLGMMSNFICAMQQSTGKYIAMCEGDDYWTDPLKLHKQVDFLERNKDCSLCFHSSMNIFENNKSKFIINRPKYMTFDMRFGIKHAIYFDGGLMATNSMFFLTEHIRNLPKWFTEASVGDWPLILLLATKGRLGYIDEIMSVYRVMSAGSWSVTNKDKNKALIHYNKLFKLLDDFNYWTNKKYSTYILIKKLYYKLVILLKFKTIR